MKAATQRTAKAKRASRLVVAVVAAEVVAVVAEAAARNPPSSLKKTRPANQARAVMLPPSPNPVKPPALKADQDVVVVAAVVAVRTPARLRTNRSTSWCGYVNRAGAARSLMR